MWQKVCTLIEFTETTLRFQETQVLSSQSTQDKEIPGPRASHPQPGQPPSLSLSHTAAFLAPQERKCCLLCIRMRRRYTHALWKYQWLPAPCPVTLPPQSHHRQPSVVLFSYSDQSLDRRWISVLDFILNSSLYIQPLLFYPRIGRHWGFKK